MAHGIGQTDYMFSANGIAPWHGLGAVIQEAPTSEDAIRIARLDWEIHQDEVYCHGKKIPGVYGNYRSDTGDTVGIITAKYKVVQNKDAFSFVNDIMAQDGIPCRYETAGSLWDGKKVWMLVGMPEKEILGDKVKNYLWFCNSHDGKSSLKAGTSSIRVVCNNTLTAAMLASPRVWVYHHVGDFAARRHEAMTTLGLATSYQESFAQWAEDMAAKKINIGKFVTSLLPIDDDMSDRVKQSVEDTRMSILTIAQDKDDLQNFKGTAWGAWNAVADHMSNSEPLRKTDTAQRTKFLSFMEGNSLLLSAEKIIIAA